MTKAKDTCKPPDKVHAESQKRKADILAHQADQVGRHVERRARREEHITERNKEGGNKKNPQKRLAAARKTRHEGNKRAFLCIVYRFHGLILHSATFKGE